MKYIGKSILQGAKLTIPAVHPPFSVLWTFFSSLGFPVRVPRCVLPYTYHSILGVLSKRMKFTQRGHTVPLFAPLNNYGIITGGRHGRQDRRHRVHHGQGLCYMLDLGFCYSTCVAVVGIVYYPSNPRGETIYHI